MTLPDVVSREQWQAARVALLTREKELTRARDALNADRRGLPMVEVTEDYVLTGPDGPVSLLEAFGGYRQLMVGHFMFDPEWEKGCGSCTAGADEYSDGLAEHLHARDTHLVHVSRAPIEKIEKYRSEKGWSFPWYSSHGSRFNYDFHVTLDPAVAPVEYNFRTPDVDPSLTVPDGGSWELPGLSCFLRDGDRVFHTYSQYARGAESTGGSYYFLDLTALGRQEDWEEPKGRAKHGAVPDFS
ncbi:DUF899 domain-containing protein [Pseudonocardia sp. KRD291]|uniref:DUF899 domain-containing protein n=1 Tax=Pseudonocardia sp. KRD291 TaxID=2792007 RepID=UPI001C4A590A|nr:DUF899 domain-containing protein [Pseudonocardia sp. KRD291]MBW0103582.1 DUF899 domain-containing protein [Pseudonocardia sp. KRD291]